MIKSIIKFLKCETTITKECKCGKQANGICIAEINVSRTGVMSQKSSELLQCGEVKKQQEACNRIFRSQKNAKLNSK